MKMEKVYDYIDKSKQKNVMKKYLKELFSAKSPKSKLLLWFVIGYILNPIDIIPDLTPVIGFLDDLTALMIAVETIRNNGGIMEFRREFKTRIERLVKNLTK